MIGVDHNHQARTHGTGQAYASSNLAVFVYCKKIMHRFGLIFLYDLYINCSRFGTYISSHGFLCWILNLLCFSLIVLSKSLGIVTFNISSLSGN